MNKFVFGHYFGVASIYEEGCAPEGFRQNRACKYIEIFYLWYLYIRKHLPADYHIFISDCASPVPIDWLLAKIPEPIDLLGEEGMELDMSKRVHVRKFTKLVNHQQGWIRTTKDWWRVCIHNNIDFFTIESDGLIAYDASQDIGENQFVINEQRDGKSYGNIYFIRRDLFDKPFQGHANFSEFLNWLDGESQGTNHLNTSEGGFQKISENASPQGTITRLDLYIQDANERDLSSFLRANPIESPVYHDYLAKIS